MNDAHETILQRYFWDLVDSGATPADTPLFTGIHGDETLGAVLVRELGLAPHEAESAIDIARKEVAL